MLTKKPNNANFDVADLAVEDDESNEYGVETINNAIVAQICLFGARRLLNKIGMIHKDDFNELKKSVADLLDLTPPKESTGLPEGNLDQDYNTR